MLSWTYSPTLVREMLMVYVDTYHLKKHVDFTFSIHEERAMEAVLEHVLKQLEIKNDGRREA